MTDLQKKQEFSKLKICLEDTRKKFTYLEVRAMATLFCNVFSNTFIHAEEFDSYYKNVLKAKKEEGLTKEDKFLLFRNKEKKGEWPKTQKTAKIN